PISDEWQPFEATLSADGNGTGTLLHGFTDVDTQQTVTNHADAESADARVALATLLHTYDITPEDGHLILSRDIFASGRTVGRINGRTVTQQVLQHVASWLVDIHGQSEHMSLLRPEQHVNFLDRYAELLSLREQLGTRVTEWREARKKLASLQQTERDSIRRAEFLRFEIEEIEKAELEPGEMEELEAERKVLNNAERLRELCTLVYGSIKGGDLGGDEYRPALDQLRPALRSMNELVRLDPELKEHETNL